jgi:hypothetical protein
MSRIAHTNRPLQTNPPALGLPLFNHWHQCRFQGFADIVSFFLHNPYDIMLSRASNRLTRLWRGCTLMFMPSRASKPKRPRDPNLLARSVVEDLIGAKWDGSPLPERKPEREKNPAAVALSNLGASKGGKARAESLSASKRKMIAKKAAAARWGKH